VIDDDTNIREYLQDFLTLEGLEVTTVADPTFAIERILGQVFHLIMLDVMMPKITGFDLLPQIRAVNPGIPVIMMTSVPSLETATASIQHQVAAFVDHPLSALELRAVIARTMKKSFALRRNALHAAIGRQLRDLREERRLTLEQVAHRTNLSVLLLSQIERGEPGVSVSSLFAIATVLDVHLADLFGDY
jgi:DNA-binding NtrC family response regulator